MKVWLVAVFVLLTTQLPRCQTANLDAWPAGTPRHIADYLSTATLGVLIAENGTRSVLNAMGTTKTHTARAVTAALGCDGLEYAAAQGGSAALKHAFPRERPDHSDTLDSFSGHTWTAFVGARTWQEWLVAGVVAYLRTAANRHDWPGVLEGFGAGVVSHYAISAIPTCRAYLR